MRLQGAGWLCWSLRAASQGPRRAFPSRADVQLHKSLRTDEQRALLHVAWAEARVPTVGCARSLLGGLVSRPGGYTRYKKRYSVRMHTFQHIPICFSMGPLQKQSWRQKLINRQSILGSHLKEEEWETAKRRRERKLNPRISY